MIGATTNHPPSRSTGDVSNAREKLRSLLRAEPFKSKLELSHTKDATLKALAQGCILSALTVLHGAMMVEPMLVTFLVDRCSPGVALLSATDQKVWMFRPPYHHLGHSSQPSTRRPPPAIAPSRFPAVLRGGVSASAAGVLVSTAYLGQAVSHTHGLLRAAHPFARRRAAPLPGPHQCHAQGSGNRGCAAARGRAGAAWARHTQDRRRRTPSSGDPAGRRDWRRRRRCE